MLQLAGEYNRVVSGPLYLWKKEQQRVQIVAQMNEALLATSDGILDEIQIE